jgi:ATP-dependent DNA helicase RecG
MNELPRLDDALPEPIRQKLKLPDRSTAFRSVHLPSMDEDIRLLNAFRSQAHFRIIFEEFFWLEAGLALKRAKARSVEGIRFELTDGSARADQGHAAVQANECAEAGSEGDRADMAAPSPMNRLLQGDVGSGKTIVAAEAAIIAIENGYQVALLAPTEILATQHYFSFKSLFTKLGYVPIC